MCNMSPSPHTEPGNSTPLPVLTLCNQAMLKSYQRKSWKRHFVQTNGWFLGENKLWSLGCLATPGPIHLVVGVCKLTHLFFDLPFRIGRGKNTLYPLPSQLLYRYLYPQQWEVRGTEMLSGQDFELNYLLPPHAATYQLPSQLHLALEGIAFELIDRSFV